MKIVEARDYHDLDVVLQTQRCSRAFGTLRRGTNAQTQVPVVVRKVEFNTVKCSPKQILKTMSSALDGFDSIQGLCCPEGITLAEDESNAGLVIYPFVDAPSLHEWRKGKGQLSEDLLIKIIRNILRILLDMDAEGRYHGHLKCSNVLLLNTSGDVMIVDQGLMTMEEFVPNPVYTTAPYSLAPEACGRAGAFQALSAEGKSQADIWSLGVLVHELVCGSTPFDAHSLPQRAVVMIKDATKPVPLQTFRGGYDESLRDFVTQCVQRDPRKRPNPHHLLKNHPFLNPSNRQRESGFSRFLRGFTGRKAPHTARRDYPGGSAHASRSPMTGSAAIPISTTPRASVEREDAVGHANSFSAGGGSMMMSIGSKPRLGGTPGGGASVLPRGGDRDRDPPPSRDTGAAGMTSSQPYPIPKLPLSRLSSAAFASGAWDADSNASSWGGAGSARNRDGGGAFSLGDRGTAPERNSILRRCSFVTDATSSAGSPRDPSLSHQDYPRYPFTARPFRNSNSMNGFNVGSIDRNDAGGVLAPDSPAQSLLPCGSMHASSPVDTIQDFETPEVDSGHGFGGNSGPASGSNLALSGSGNHHHPQLAASGSSHATARPSPHAEDSLLLRSVVFPAIEGVLDDVPAGVSWKLFDIVTDLQEVMSSVDRRWGEATSTFVKETISNIECSQVSSIRALSMTPNIPIDPDPDAVPNMLTVNNMRGMFAHKFISKHVPVTDDE